MTIDDFLTRLHEKNIAGFKLNGESILLETLYGLHRNRKILGITILLDSVPLNKKDVHINIEHEDIQRIINQLTVDIDIPNTVIYNKIIIDIQTEMED